jgi:hypothetical protein
MNEKRALKNKSNRKNDTEIKAIEPIEWIVKFLHTRYPEIQTTGMEND